MARLGMLFLMVIACDGSSAIKEHDSGRSNVAAPSGDGGKDCFDNPKTHFEIINACTTATRIEKNPTLPKLLADGGLPPLN